MNSRSHHRRAVALATIILALAVPLAGCQTPAENAVAASAPVQPAFHPTADQLERAVPRDAFHPTADQRERAGARLSFGSRTAL